MEKQQLLVDMDGVLADVYKHLIEYDFREFGTRKTEKELEGVLELDAFAHGRQYVMTKGFFRTVPVMEGSVEGLRYLNDKYKVFIVSSATEFPDSLSEKLYWLNEHFPFIAWQQMIFCGSKQPVAGDIMLDDHFKNLDYFTGKTLLYTQPHNANAPEGRHTRVDGWEEVMRVL